MFGQNKAIFYRYEEFRQNGLKMGLIVKHRFVADRHRQTDRHRHGHRPMASTAHA